MTPSFVNLLRHFGPGDMIPVVVDYFSEADSKYNLADPEAIRRDEAFDQDFTLYDFPQTELQDMVNLCGSNDKPDWKPGDYDGYEWEAIRNGDDLYIIPDGGW